MKKYYTILMLLAPFMLSCDKDYSISDSILSYYSSDKEKQVAAIFLLDNMPNYGCRISDNQERYLSYYEALSSCKGNANALIDSLKNKYWSISSDDFYYVSDDNYISAKTLINDIDCTFKIKNSYGWNLKISKDDFFEYVLPYRVGDEYYKAWRKEAIGMIEPLLDSLNSHNVTELTDVANSIIKTWNTPPFKWSGSLPSGPSIGFSNIKLKAGTCREYAEGLTFLLRAAGIPSGIDYTIVRGDNNARHYWPFVIGKNEQTFVSSTEQPILTMSKFFPICASKIYRKAFSENPEWNNILKNYRRSEIHPNFRRINMRDVTNLYKQTFNISLKLKHFVKNGDLVYLCNANHMEWEPVAFSQASKQFVKFENVAAGTVLIVCTWNGKSLQPVSEPFYLAENKQIHFYSSNSEYITAELYCKFPLSEKNGDLVCRMKGGVIEGCNSPSFKDATVLYRIDEAPIRKLTEVNINNPESFRFIRYRGADSTFCNIAELMLFSNDSVNLATHAKIFGTPRINLGDGKHDYVNVFDGDIDTSFDYDKPSGGWAAVDLHEPKRIARIIFAPRNRDNYIRKGDIYELFYWSTTVDKWISVGAQKATSDFVRYKFPKNALLFLKNHTRGKDERIFEFDCNANIQKFR
jgi:hypothetical protein